ncbi:MAG: GNAT family N-acetyltransferase [Opitutaceae bacterium]
MEIVRAKPSDAAALTAVAFAAKRHWGYPESWIRQWRGSLTITPAFIADNPVFAAVSEKNVLGFGALRIEGGIAEIDHLWVLPVAMGRGVGRRLFATLEGEAKNRRVRTLRLQADPNAEGFYLRMGARTVSRVPAAVNGAERFLPVMEKELGLSSEFVPK